MSHTTEISGIVFNDIDALRDAVKALNAAGVACELQQNTKPRAYYANQTGMGVAPYVLRLNAADYDVGFYTAPKGGYVARTDLFRGKVAQVLGVPCADNSKMQQAALGKLYQAYAVAAIKRQAHKAGKICTVSTAPDGSIKLTMNY